MDVRSISPQTLLDALTPGPTSGDKDDAFARMLDGLTRPRQETARTAQPEREPVRSTLRDRPRAAAEAQAQAKAAERRAARERDEADAADATREAADAARAPQPREHAPAVDRRPPPRPETGPGAKAGAPPADRPEPAITDAAPAADEPMPADAVADETAAGPGAEEAPADDAAAAVVAPGDDAAPNEVTVEATVTVTETVITLIGPGQTIELTSTSTDLEVEVTADGDAVPVDAVTPPLMASGDDPALPVLGGPGADPLPEEALQDADSLPLPSPALPEPAVAETATGPAPAGETMPADAVVPSQVLPVGTPADPAPDAATDADAAVGAAPAAMAPTSGNAAEKLAAATANPAQDAAPDAEPSERPAGETGTAARDMAEAARFQDVAGGDASGRRGHGEERPREGAAKPVTPAADNTQNAQGQAQSPGPAPALSETPLPKPPVEAAPTLTAPAPAQPPVADGAQHADHGSLPITILEAARATASADPASPVIGLRAGRGTAHAPMGVPDQLSVHIQRNVKEGNDQFTIQLRPDELGRIDIRLEFGQDGKVSASIAVERPQTLEMLQRDARGLERALQEAGLNADSDSLSFSLRGEGNPFESHGQGARNAGRGRRGGGADLPEEAADLAAYTMTLGPGRVDVRV